MTETRCELCNKAILSFEGEPWDLPGERRLVMTPFQGAGFQLGQFERLERHVMYRPHVETCPRAKELQKKLDAAEGLARAKREAEADGEV